MERLDKLIANASTLSRKEVHRLIKSGGVSVNGIITKDRGFCIDPDTARVCVGGRELSLQKYTYLMLNKPQGIVSAARDDKEKTVVDLVPEQYKKKNLFPAGRLDKEGTEDYDIVEAAVRGVQGDLENGLVFCSEAAGRTDRFETVRDVFREFTTLKK